MVLKYRRIYVMDCLEGMRKYVSDKEVDVIVTSPPYNIGMEYHSYEDTMQKEDYLGWMEDIAREYYRVLSDNGSIFLNLGNRPSEQWNAVDVALRFRKYFVLQNTILWVKSITIDGVSYGHYKPVVSNRFLNSCFEYIYHFTKFGDVELDRLAIGVPYADKRNIERWSSGKSGLRCRGNVWFIPYETIHSSEEERPHPATFPVKLPEMCIRLHGIDRARLVMDTFMGLGSTAIACEKLDIDWIGFEIDEYYADIANKRLSSIRKV